MFNQLGVIGCGLMGGSFALALKRGGVTATIVGTDRDLRKPECFACKAPDAVPYDRPGHKALRHDQREPRTTEIVGKAIQIEAGRPREAARLEHR